jgi:NADH dehydrogenase/NADH:ubiquinone oxidoreductase subunit G
MRMSRNITRDTNGDNASRGGGRNIFEASHRDRNWRVGVGRRYVEKRTAQRPHYCYKEGRRGVSATCRICRVEVGGARKPVPSCAMPVATDIGVWTETPLVQKVREGVRERRLANHPLDCPICDQGGECDLQEQTLGYGSDASRMLERKRAVEDKDRTGPVKIVMTRCIHCTRCVRYVKQVANAGRGIRGRGKTSEIGVYTAHGSRQTLMAGNRTDLCPVMVLHPWTSC